MRLFVVQIWTIIVISKLFLKEALNTIGWLSQSAAALAKYRVKYFRSRVTSGCGLEKVYCWPGMNAGQNDTKGYTSTIMKTAYCHHARDIDLLVAGWNEIQLTKTYKKYSRKVSMQSRNLPYAIESTGIYTLTL